MSFAQIAQQIAQVSTSQISVTKKLTSLQTNKTLGYPSHSSTQRTRFVLSRHWRRLANYCKKLEKLETTSRMIFRDYNLLSRKCHSEKKLQN
jgi:hypothetical protein